MPRPAKSRADRPPYAKRLESVRELLSLDMAQFAKMLGLEPETYRRYERGETQPNVDVWARISDNTGFSLDFLIAGKQPMLSPSPTGPKTPQRAA